MTQPGPTEGAPLVVHVVHRLAVGGLENGLVNVINHMPPGRYRHAIVSLTDATEFRDRIERTDVPIIELHKRPGQDLTTHRRLWTVLRSLRPGIVHTRNLPTLECQVLAAAARVPARVHGEHGRDVYDLDGQKRRYVLLRKAMRPLVHRFVAVSTDLANWLRTTIGVRPDRVTQIYNGVDLARFHPGPGHRQPLGPDGFADPGCTVVGTVGRMEHVKDQLTLVRAFVRLLEREPRARARVRLIMVGDGALQHTAIEMLRAANAEQLAWLPGERRDVPDIMRGLDVFVLPSLREGISNTILEAMATGLPVVATRVGGNPELIDEGETGILVPPEDPDALAEAIGRYVDEPDTRRRHGSACRSKVEARFSIASMIRSYLAVYDTVLQPVARGRRSTRWGEQPAR